MTEKYRLLILYQFSVCNNKLPIPVVQRSKTRDCDRSIAGTVGLNSAWGMDVCFLCVLSGRGLWVWPITRSGGVLSTVVCQCVLSIAVVPCTRAVG